jgi:hypothetical protein
MATKQQACRWTLIGSLLTFLVYMADVLVGKFAQNADVLSDGLFATTTEALVLFASVILLLIGAVLSERDDK